MNINVLLGRAAEQAATSNSAAEHRANAICAPSLPLPGAQARTVLGPCPLFSLAEAQKSQVPSLRAGSLGRTVLIILGLGLRRVVVAPRGL